MEMNNDIFTPDLPIPEPVGFEDAPIPAPAEEEKPVETPPPRRRRKADASVLTIESGDEIETADAREAAAWHEIHNAYRTRRILSASLGGIEQPDSGKTIDHNQMRRGKQSTGISGFSKDRSQKCTGASLSICSCHMYNLKLLLRISKTPQAFFCVLQFILCCKFRSFFNISNRFFVIHKKIHHSSNVFAAIWSLKPNRYDIIIYEW